MPTPDALEQLTRYADAVDRAAERREPVPVASVEGRGGRRGPVLAVATVAAAVLLVVGVVAVVRDDGDDARDVHAAGGQQDQAIGGQRGCLLHVAPGEDRVLPGPPPGTSLTPDQPPSAHIVTGSDLTGYIHAPGLVVIDLTGEQVEQITIRQGAAALWLGDAFTQLRYFPGGQAPCSSFAVTATGGTAAERRALVTRVAERLTNQERFPGATGPTAAHVSVPAVPLPTTPPSGDGGAIVSEIMTAAGPQHAIGNGFDGTRWTIELLPGRDALAEAIRARHGDRVRILVGGVEWPVAEGAPGCPAFDPLETPSAPGLSATLAPPTSGFPLGTDVSAMVTIHNRSDSAVTLPVGQAVAAYLLGPDGRLAGHAFARVITGVMLEGLTVDAGESSDPLRAIAGIASCDPANGTAVQPGSYALVAQVMVDETHAITSDPVIVTITAP